LFSGLKEYGAKIADSPGAKALGNKLMEDHPAPAVAPSQANPNVGGKQTQNPEDQIAMILQRLFGAAGGQ